MRFEPGTLYECEKPPVVEVIIGVAFEPIEGLDAVHFGAYWESIRNRFPGLSVRSPILPPVAPPRVANLESGEPFLFRADPTVRYWFVDKAEEELIQVQSDRFFRNWRKGPADTSYPRFSELWQRFADSWAEYFAFLSEHGFGIPTVLQCELGYVNRVALEGQPLSWALPSLALGDISPHLPATPDRRAMVRTHLPDGLGVAQVDIQSAAEGGWRFSLSAKGKPSAAGAEGVEMWLLNARGWLNHLFVSSLGDGYRTQLGVRPRS